MRELSGVAPNQIRWRREGIFAKFTPDIETAFSHFYNDQLLRTARWSALAAIMVMLTYTIMDIFISPNGVRPTLFLIRFSLSIIPLTVLFWSSFQQWRGKYFQILCGIVYTLVGITVISVVNISSKYGSPISYDRVIIAIFFFYSCCGMRVNLAALSSAIVTASHATSVYYYGSGIIDTIAHMPILILANAIGLIGGSIIEASARRNFALVTQLHDQANRDFLTGTFNRRALREKLDLIWDRATCERQAVTLAMVDVDLFKSFNDTYGHFEGDKVLRQIADVLQAHTQGSFAVTARFGGEEFICVWTGKDPAAMRELLGRIQRDVVALNIPHSRSPLAKVSVSLGAVQLSPAQGTDIKTALRNADQLLYQAKAHGRNSVAFAENTRNEPVSHQDYALID